MVFICLLLIINYFTCTLNHFVILLVCVSSVSVIVLLQVFINITSISQTGQPTDDMEKTGQFFFKLIICSIQLNIIFLALEIMQLRTFPFYLQSKYFRITT